MAYVSVPKDLTRVKNKVAFNLTRRQIICFGIAGVIGIPFYLFTRNLIGNGNAMMGMVVLMIPSFLFAMYEKDGMPLEKVLMNMITVKTEHSVPETTGAAWMAGMRNSMAG